MPTVFNFKLPKFRMQCISFSIYIAKYANSQYAHVVTKGHCVMLKSEAVMISFGRIK